MDSLTCRLMQRSSEADRRALQQVLLAAPAYSLLVEGALPSKDAAINLFAELPPCKTHEDKFVLGFFVGADPAGCAEIIRGYPTAEVAFVGLLLFAEPFQGKALGVVALAHIESFVRPWACNALRIAVMANNQRAHGFWKHQGFAELYRKPAPPYIGEAIVMQRALALQSGRAT